MIIASGPYISRHFCNTVKDNDWPVIDAGGAAEFGLATSPELSGPNDIERVAEAARGRILTSGEHALGWLTEHLGGSPEARASALFKDKAAFRRPLEPLFPVLYFSELSAAIKIKRLLSAKPRSCLNSRSLLNTSAGIGLNCLRPFTSTS